MKKKKHNWENYFSNLGKIGNGGNAQVYHVQDRRTGEHYALKELSILSAEKKSRFLSEIKITEKNASTTPGMIPIYYSNKAEYWYTMPIADSIMQKIPEMTVKDIILGTIQLCDTLSSLHARGVSHRDIKPSNIYQYNGRFCLGDFGLVDFPNSPNHFTRSDRGLGAIFTIAPEMKRDPKSADGKKADVYSLAKTLWMFLSEDQKGFEGVYNNLDAKHSLRLYRKCGEIHLVEIEELLRDATCNDPILRPSMEEFGGRLREWIDIFEDEDKSQISDWRFLQKQLFGSDSEIPDSAKWAKIDSIVSVLNKIGRTPAFNHMYFSDGGGLDFAFSETAPEAGCIYLYDTTNACFLLKPRTLEYEGFDDVKWNYFILDMEELAPIVAEPSVGSCERLAEDFPGHYVDAKDYVYGVYDYDTGVPLPPDSKLVFRYTKGRLLFVMKWGPYNHLNVTYDGRHGKFSNCAKFREYVGSLANMHSMFYSAIAEQVKGEDFSLREIDHIIFQSELFRFNPFISQEDIDKEKSKIEAAVDVLHKEESYASENLIKWNFSSVLSSPRSEAFAAKYYFVFHHSRGNGFGFFERKELFLCQNGNICALFEPDDAICFYVTDRSTATQIKELLQNEVRKQILAAGLEPSEDTEKWVSVEMRKSGSPTHLFTKQEIEEKMRAADDRKHNRLVIDEYGYVQIVEGGGVSPPFAVYHETWCAGNNYVGKYSPLYTLEEDYLLMLDGWLDYLRTGESQAPEFISENITEEQLLDEIRGFYVTRE